MQSVWSVTYSVPGMRNWLQRHGFSYKKPALVPGKANEQQQREWLAEYEKLKQNLPENETICFMDGVRPTHNVQLMKNREIKLIPFQENKVINLIVAIV